MIPISDTRRRSLEQPHTLCASLAGHTEGGRGQWQLMSPEQAWRGWQLGCGVAFPRSPSGHKAKEMVCSWHRSWRVCVKEMEASCATLTAETPVGQTAGPRLTPHLSVRCSSLKTCTVSVLLEAQRNCESMLNTRELMFTYLGPRQDSTGHFMAYWSRGTAPFCSQRGWGGRTLIQGVEHPAHLLPSPWDD